MSAEIIPFDFEEQAVRVVMRDGEPWFVANDVCRVLEIGNPRDAVARLDDDERDSVGIADAIGRERETNAVSESGLYALIFTSRKAEAKRFRKWITAEVLPAIRRHGRYEMPGLPANDAAGESGDFAGMSFREAELWLQSVREARLTRGTRAAIRIWDRSPLPRLGPQVPEADPAQGRAALAHLTDRLGAAIDSDRAGGCDLLAEQGLRARPDGLFVANRALPVFAGTAWADAAHRAALAALPGVFAPPHPLTLAGVVGRGLVLPWPLIDGEGVA